MSSDHAGTEYAATIPWFETLVAGVVAGAGAGLLFHYQLFILPLFGLLYGQPTVAGGTLLHVVVSIGFAAVFTGAVTRTGLRTVATGPGRIAAMGLAYGAGLWIIAFGILLPLLTRVTPAQVISIPYLPLDGLVAHVVFGLLLGGTFAVLWEPPTGAELAD